MTPRESVKRIGHFDLLGWAYQQTDGTPIERFILVVLATMASEQGICWPSISTISERTGAGRSTVLRAIAHWKARGVLTTTPRTYQGQRKVLASEYHLNPQRFPVESVDYDEETRLDAGPVQIQDPTRPDAGPPIGITNESPEVQLHIPDAPRPRRKKRTAPAEDQLRGAWHSDPEDTSDENPVDDLLHDAGLSNGKFVAALIEHYRLRAKRLEPIATTNKDAMASYFMRALKTGTSRQVLLDAIDAFFDQQVYDADRGTLWKQLLDSMPRLAAKKVARAAESEGDFSSGGALRRRRA